MLKAALVMSAILACGSLTRGVCAQELRIASHGTVGGGPAAEKPVFDLGWGLSLTGAWDPASPWRLGPWGMVGTNQTIHSHASGGVMGLWKSDTSTSWALLGALGGITPLHRAATWETGVTVRTALVLWYEDEGRVLSVASPTLGIGVEARSMPRVAGYGRENEVIFQLAIDPVAAAIYVPFLIGVAIYGPPH